MTKCKCPQGKYLISVNQVHSITYILNATAFLKISWPSETWADQSSGELRRHFGTQIQRETVGSKNRHNPTRLN